MTAKSSICVWGVFYKSGVYAVKVSYDRYRVGKSIDLMALD